MAIYRKPYCYDAFVKADKAHTKNCKIDKNANKRQNKTLVSPDIYKKLLPTCGKICFPKGFKK